MKSIPFTAFLLAVIITPLCIASEALVLVKDGKEALLSAEQAVVETVTVPAAEVEQMSRRVPDDDPASTESPVEMHSGADRQLFVVGQRDFDNPTGLEVRSVLRFDLSDLPKDPAKIEQVTLSIFLRNAIRTIGGEGGQPKEGMPPLVNPDQPFDPVVVDHLAPSDSNGISAAAYDAMPLRENIGVIVEGKVNLRSEYSLDVTEAVRADLAARRTSSEFRLRPIDGFTVRDEHSHYLIFCKQSDEKGKAPRLDAAVRRE